MSFARTKLIDLIWDLALGHGGRLLHGWVLYQVATKAIAWMLECFVLSYSVLLSILFQENSFSSLWSLICSLKRRQRLRTVFMTIFLIFSTLPSYYILWGHMECCYRVPESRYRKLRHGRSIVDHQGYRYAESLLVNPTKQTRASWGSGRRCSRAQLRNRFHVFFRRTLQEALGQKYVPRMSWCIWRLLEHIFL